MLVLHCSAYPADKLIDVFKEYKVSAHYIIEENGEIIRLVDEAKAAYHAGVGFWRGRSDSCNMRSIGIELVNMSLGQTPVQRGADCGLGSVMQRADAKVSDCGRKTWSGIRTLSLWARLIRGFVFRGGVWQKKESACGMIPLMPKRQRKAVFVPCWRKSGIIHRMKKRPLASAYAFRRRFLPEEVCLDNDVMHLVDNVYPVGDKSLLSGEKFINCLKAVAYRYETLENSSKGYTLINERQNRLSR